MCELQRLFSNRCKILPKFILPSTSNSPVQDVYDFIEQDAPEESVIYLGVGKKDFKDTCVALRDALLAVKIPFLEVHISDIESREEFRQKSIISHACTSSIIGMGSNGYLYALRQISIL